MVAYAPAVSLLELTRSTLARFVDAGWLRPEAVGDEAVRAHTVLMAGVISQQLPNQPATDVDEGSFTRLIPLLTGMFFDAYATGDQSDTAAGAPDRHSRTGHTQQTEADHAETFPKLNGERPNLS